MVDPKLMYKLLEKDQLLEIIEIQEKEYATLREGVDGFLQKNFVGGPKSDREDYSQMVSAKDIWDLKNLLEIR